MSGADFVPATKREFFAAIGRMDVTPRAEADCCVWETRGRVVVGLSKPGYATVWSADGPAPSVYMLARRATGSAS